MKVAVGKGGKHAREMVSFILVTVAAGLERTFYFNQFGVIRIITLEGLKVPGNLTAIPDITIYVLCIPVVGVFNDLTIFFHNVVDDMTGNTVNQFCLPVVFSIILPPV